MSLLGEEALEEIWNLVKEKITEEQQKYKYSFESDVCKVTIIRQINICVMHIAAEIVFLIPVTSPILY